MFKKKYIRRGFITLALLLAGFIWWLSRPVPGLLEKPASTVLEDRNGRLVGARVASDEQWRFPHNDSVPEKFQIALLQFEDKRYFSHPGVDPLALFRAIRLNIEEGGVVSGASTITMQLARLLGDNASRTYKQKIRETFNAFRLEFQYSKEELLALYCSHAPFGGNVVGLDAASWRFFGKEAEHLSWAESAMLAVLPNAPSLIHVGKNRDKLLEKRNKLLDRLYERGYIDEITHSLSLNETVPQKPRSLPADAYHLTERVRKEYPSHLRGKEQQRFKTTLDHSLQKQVSSVVDRHSARHSKNRIYDMAAMVVDVASNEILAYAGNSRINKFREGASVDILTSVRTPGSLLKPFLYAGMLSEGTIYPTSLVSDVPVQYGSYKPRNFNRGFMGVIPAHQSLARSLNVPAVGMLDEYGIQKFTFLLRSLGMSTLVHPPDYYGLSLVLGGGGAKAVEIAGMYRGLAGLVLNNVDQQGSAGLFSEPRYLTSESVPVNTQRYNAPVSPVSRGAAWHTLEALLDVEKPDSEEGSQSYAFSQPVAWKTGTSFGFKDGWAVGVNKRYLVLVWAGNASGRGQPGLTGIDVAAPVLFEIFRSLPESEWFDEPAGDLRFADVCKRSGYPPSAVCNEINEVLVPVYSRNPKTCPYHEFVFMDQAENWRVYPECEDPDNIKRARRFILPPAEDYYSRPFNPDYESVPPIRSDCRSVYRLTASDRKMHLVYPREGTVITFPSEKDSNEAVFDLVHKNPKSLVYWHINDRYIGKTQLMHQKKVALKVGTQELKIFDEEGNTIRRSFIVEP